MRKGKWTMQLTLFGECLARKENRAEIDPSLVDVWGIPALKMNVTFSDNELKLQQDGKEQAEEMLKACGASEVKQYGAPSTPGASIHEIGGARMGNDPRTSVLNKWPEPRCRESVCDGRRRFRFQRLRQSNADDDGR